MTPRLYVDAPLAAGDLASLDDEQRHYLRNVLRAEAGAAVLVFNARDGEFRARIETMSKKAAVVRLGKHTRAPESEADLWLLIAPVKRAPLDLIVQKATELGVAEVHPVVTERTRPVRAKEERLRAIAREAAEQSGRMSIPRIARPRPLGGVLADWPQERRLVFCDEAGDDPKAPWGGVEGRAPALLEAVRDMPSGAVALLIGPEGGFSPEERARLRALPFVVPATLGPRILRADTAAIAALALLQASVGDWRSRTVVSGEKRPSAPAASGERVAS
jgi:16S rRNA (uracil1498-N3)-methyltransferase